MLLDRLVTRGNADGSWGYRSGLPGCAEPTALACLSLAAHGIATDRLSAGLDWLRKMQRPDGSVPVSTTISTPGWATGLAVSAWMAGRGKQVDAPHQCVAKAVDWLLAMRGIKLRETDQLGHNTQLQGWPWVSNTHSWVEPTAYALLALRAANNTNHPRFREGIALLMDRVLPGGGWNYGNTQVLGQTLRPFPATTGVALAALAGQPEFRAIEKSLAYLTEALATARSPLSTAWGVIGLKAWKRQSHEAERLLNRAAEWASDDEPNALHDALLLLAAADVCPLTTQGARDHA